MEAQIQMAPCSGQVLSHEEVQRISWLKLDKNKKGYLEF